MKTAKLHFTTLVLGCYAVFLFYLISSGAIAKFINPKLTFLSVIALVIIGAMIFHNIARMQGQITSSTACQHHEIGLSSYLLFLPILLSVMIAPGTISYQPATNLQFEQPILTTGASPYNNQQGANVKALLA